MRLIDADEFINYMKENIDAFERSGSEIAKAFYIPYFKQMIRDINMRPTVYTRFKDTPLTLDMLSDVEEEEE